jgi:regulator of protease activity HflC (stomatin/prohibitin superfamily)
MSATIISAPPARTAFVDRELHAGNGYVMLGIGLALIAISCWLVYTGFVVGHSLVRACIALPAIIFAIAVLKGLVVVQPNESLVCLLFGSYVGTEHRPGFWVDQSFQFQAENLAPPGDIGEWPA